jgi:predicted transposase YbfD/YdcC
MACDVSFAGCAAACALRVGRFRGGAPAGKERLGFLRRFLPFERGLPSHDMLNDVISALDGELFKACFTRWVEALRDHQPDIIAVDGNGGDYQLALKGNCPATHADVATYFDNPPAEMIEEVHVTTDADHGRIETRRHLVCHDVNWLFPDRRFQDEPHFPRLTMIGMVETGVERGGRRQSERRDHLSSAKLDAKAFAHAVRSHWGIENRLRWILDVVSMTISHGSKAQTVLTTWRSSSTSL